MPEELRMSRLAASAIAVLAAALLALAAAAPSGEPYSPFNTGPRGYSRIALAVQLSFSVPSPPRDGRGLLVVPLASPLEGSDAERLVAWLEAGATVLILDEQGFSNTLYGRLGLGLRVVNATVYDVVYNAGDRFHPMARLEAPGLEPSTVVFYTPSTLNTAERGVTVLAASSPYAYADLDGDGYYSRGDLSGRLPLIAEARVGRGRLVVVADLDFLANEELELGRGNAELVKALAEGGRTVLVTGSLRLSWLDRLGQAYYTMLGGLVGREGARALAAYAAAIAALWVVRRYEEAA